MTKAALVTLPEKLKIAGAHSLHDEFENLIQKNNSEMFTLDAGAVSAVDTAGIQLVVAFVKALKERHLNVTWKGASPCFSDAVKSLGLQSALELN